jgi:hypothetical protein
VTPPIRYSQSQSEKLADENEISRQIVREINNFGITQRQTLMVIYLLAVELENHDHMRALTRLVRELGGEELFLIGQPEPDVEAGGTDGTPNV